MQKISADPKRNRDMEEGKAVDGECPSTAFCFGFSHKPHPGKCMISEFQRQKPVKWNTNTAMQTDGMMTFRFRWMS